MTWDTSISQKSSHFTKHFSAPFSVKASGGPTQRRPPPGRPSAGSESKAISWRFAQIFIEFLGFNGSLERLNGSSMAFLDGISVFFFNGIYPTDHRPFISMVFPAINLHL